MRIRVRIRVRVGVRVTVRVSLVILVTLSGGARLWQLRASLAQVISSTRYFLSRNAQASRVISIRVRVRVRANVTVGVKPNLQAYRVTCR